MAEETFLVQELMEENQRLSEQLASKDLEKVKIPYVRKNQLLINEGVHNGWYYPASELQNARLEMEYGLFFDHNDGTSTQVGTIENPHWSNDGDKGPGIYGDVVILEKPVAQKLEYGVKWGLSPTVDIDKQVNSSGEQIATDPVFMSWSCVLNPAVRATMLNKQMEAGNMVDANVEKMAQELAQKKLEEEQKIQKLAEELAQKKEDLAKKKTEDEEKKAKEDAELAEKAKLEAEARKQLMDENKQLKEQLSKIENERITKESSMLLEKELSIGVVMDAEKGDRFEAIKKMNDETRKELGSYCDKIVSGLMLDADEHPEKYLKDAEGLSAKELSEYTDFVKKFLKENKGATIAEAAKAYKKEKMAGKKYPYPYPPEKQAAKKYPYPMGKMKMEAVDDKQTLSSEGAESDSVEQLSQDPLASSKSFLQFMIAQQGGN